MTSMNIDQTVSGYARDAASARLLVAARPSWISGGGVCPPEAFLRSGIGDTGLRVRFIEFATSMPSSQHFDGRGFTRPFKQHHQGSTVPRPPV